MMLSLVYDGTPMGLITAMAYVIGADNGTDASPLLELVPGSRFRSNLFTEARQIATDYASAGSFLRELASRLPTEIWQELFVCFFTGEPSMELPLLNYVRLLLRTGGKAADNWADDNVRRVRQLSGRIRYEIQRLHGFVRFERLPNGLYYAQVTPDHPLLLLLAPHFAARFADQEWLIHDLRRDDGIYYDRIRWVYLPKVEFPTPTDSALLALDTGEAVYQDIWCEYFRRIAIEERTNPGLQRQRLPTRYRRHMTEMRD